MRLIKFVSNRSNKTEIANLSHVKLQQNPWTFYGQHGKFIYLLMQVSFVTNK